MMKKFVYVLAGMVLVFFSSVSCNKTDEWEKIKKEVDSLKTSHPSGIVILQHSANIVKGDTATINFRTNPSNFKVTAENLYLDAVSENIYDYYKESEKKDDDVKSSVPYNKDAVNFKLASVSPAKNEAGDTLAGQWVAKIATNGDEAVKYYEEAIVSLILKYVDNQGVEQMISSDIMSMNILPTISEGLYVWKKSCYSQRILTDTITPNAYISFDANKFKKRGTGDDGEVKLYSITDNIESINAVLTQEYEGVFSIKTVMAQEENSYIEFVPNPQHKKWTELKESGDSCMIVPFVVTVSDKYLHSVSDTLYFTYFAKNTTVYSFDFKAASGTTTLFDLTDHLKECGYLKEDLMALRRLGTLNNVNCSIPGFITKFSIDKEGNVTLQVTSYTKHTPGTVYYDPDNFYAAVLTMVYPSFLMTPECKALHIRINLKATIVE